MTHEERFADALDAIVSGEAPRDSDPLVTFALAFQAAEGAPNADPLEAERRALIWRTLMQDTTRQPTTTGGPGPLSQPAMALPANPWVRAPGPRSRRGGIVPGIAHIQPFISALAVVALLLAAWGSFASFRETGSPSVTPTAFAHGAASATPPASPAAENEWLTVITPEECHAEPMSREDYAALISESRTWPTSRDLPLQPVEPAIAEEVARAAREHDACQIGGTRQIMKTDRYVYETSNTALNPVPREEKLARDLQRGMEISVQFPIQDPASFRFLTSETVMRNPSSQEPYGFFAYIPDYAVALADGRIAIPVSTFYSELDPRAPPAEAIAATPNFATFLMIFSDESGQWLLDERLVVCIGDCTEIWNDQLEYLDLPTIEASPVASPIATPLATPQD